MCLLGRSDAIIWGWAGYGHLTIAGSACNLLFMWHDTKTWLNRPLNISHCCPNKRSVCPDSKIHGTDAGSTWGRQDPGGPHVGPTNLDILVFMYVLPQSNPQSFAPLHIRASTSVITVQAFALEVTNQQRVQTMSTTKFGMLFYFEFLFA